MAETGSLRRKGEGVEPGRLHQGEVGVVDALLDVQAVGEREAFLEEAFLGAVQTQEVASCLVAADLTEINSHTFSSLQCRRNLATERILIKRAPSWAPTRKRLGER